MPISMECPSCMNSFSLPDELAGRKSKCPDCQFTVFVPRAETHADQTAAVSPSPAPAPAPTPPAAPKAKSKKKAIDVAAVTPVPQKKTRAVKKAPPVKQSDNPFAFDDDESSRPRRNRGSGGVMLLLVLLALFAFGGLLIVAGGGAFWLYWSRTKAEEARVEAEARATVEARAKIEALQAEMEAIRAAKEAKVQELPKEEPKPDKPKKPDGKPMDPIAKPMDPIAKPIDPEKIKPNQPPTSVPPPPAKQPRLTLAPITEYTVKAGETVKISVSVVREDCKGIVTINVTGLPPGVRAEPVILDDDIDRANLQVTADATAAPGKYSLSVTATLAAKKPVTDGKMFELTIAKAAPAPDQPVDTGKGPLQLLGGVRIAVSAQLYSFHTGPVESVALSPDGKVALSGGADGVVQLMNLEKERPTTATINKIGPAIAAVAVSPDGKWGASGDVKGTVRLYNMEKKTSQVLTQAKAQPGMPDADRVTALEFSPKSDLLAVLTPRALVTYKVLTGDKGLTTPLDGSPCCHFAADGANVYAITGKTIAVVDTRRAGGSSPLGGGKPREFAATTFDYYSSKQELLALVPKDKQVELQRINEKTAEVQTLIAFTEMNEIPTRLVVADKSGYALTCDRTGQVCGWELDTGKQLFKLDREKVELRSLAVNPDGRRAIAGGADGTTRIFDFRNEKPN